MIRLFLYVLAALVLAADQATKQWVLRVYPYWGGGQDIIPGFFTLTYVHNTGGAFGILPGGTLWLALAAAVASVAIVVYTIRVKKPLSLGLAIALGLPLGGAIGNLLDRVRLHFVVDFLYLHAGTHQFPVFNVADSAICVGVALLAVRFWRQPDPAAPPAAVPTEN